MTETIKPKKSLGQNFLVNEYTINTILEIINLSDGDLVLEVGPGQGALTKNIIGKTKPVSYTHLTLPTILLV